jgi:hypothetical protein
MRILLSVLLPAPPAFCMEMNVPASGAVTRSFYRSSGARHARREATAPAHAQRVLTHVLVGEQRFALANRMPPSGQVRKNLLGHASPGHALADVDQSEEIAGQQCLAWFDADRRYPTGARNLHADFHLH